MLSTLALLLTVTAPADGVQMKFLPSGAVQKAGGYMPIRALMSSDATGVKKKPDVTAPHYGKIVFGDKSVLFILDEPDGQTPHIYVDSNNDGDLTNDPAVTWAPRKSGDYTMYMGSTKVDIGKSEPVGITMYRFDPKDPGRAALKDTLLYYGDFGYEVTITLDGKAFPSFIAGEPNPKGSLAIDRNGDGRISYKRETIVIGQPFNFTGTTYVLNVANGGLALTKATEKLAIAPLPPNLAIGEKALTFKADTLDGGKINFPGDFKGKIVMLDFWATWCGPCIGELPNVKKAYEDNHDKGFEILGVTFDQANMADKVKDFTQKNGMPWKQVYEGKFWDTTIGGMYDVNAIPFTLLVDGDTGKILATGDTMRGPGLTALIEKTLAAKRASR